MGQPNGRESRRWLEPARWTTFSKLAGAFVAYLVAMNVGAALIARATGYVGDIGKVFALSMSAGYSPAAAHLTLIGLGPSGRKADVITLAAFDVFFPLVYTALLSVGLLVVTRYLGLHGRVRRAAIAVPFGAAVANWLADVAIIVMLLTYPAESTALALAASVFTTVKLFSLGLSAAGIALGAAVILGRLIITRRPRQMTDAPGE